MPFDQAASGSSSKADGLYEYYQDRCFVPLHLEVRHMCKYCTETLNIDNTRTLRCLAQLSMVAYSVHLVAAGAMANMMTARSTGFGGRVPSKTKWTGTGKVKCHLFTGSHAPHAQPEHREVQLSLATVLQSHATWHDVSASYRVRCLWKDRTSLTDITN